MTRESEYEMILRMLQEGTIDAEEAEKLLAALSDRESDSEARLSVDEETAGVDVESADLSEMIRGVVSSITESGLMGSIGGSQSYERELTGQFDSAAVQESGSVAVKGAAKNGRIEVRGWDSDEYKVIIRAKVRGGDRSRAREVAEEYVEVVQDATRLTVDGRENLPLNSAVSMEIYLPDELVYDLDLLTSNGRIHLADLRGAEVLGRTSNGRIGCENLRARSFDLKTSNGRIEVDGAVGDVEVETTNGSIKIRPREVREDSSYRARTTNGKIVLDYTPGEETGVKFEARTTNGKISIPWDDLDLEIDQRRGRRRTHIKGTTAGYAARDIQLEMDFRTTNGAIKVGE